MAAVEAGYTRLSPTPPIVTCNHWQSRFLRDETASASCEISLNILVDCFPYGTPKATVARSLHNPLPTEYQAPGCS